MYARRTNGPDREQSRATELVYLKLSERGMIERRPEKSRGRNDKWGQLKFDRNCHRNRQ